MTQVDAYRVQVQTLRSRGIDVAQVEARLAEQAIETPSWGYGNSGTRFGVFKQPGAARSVEERLADAAQVHQLTGACPTVALHIPWDKVDDYAALRQYAEGLGVRIGAVTPNVFEDQAYRYGSLANADPAVRQRALDDILGVIDMMGQVGSHILSLWFADGTCYPGQADFTDRKHRFGEGLAKAYAAMPDDVVLMLEYKPFEPTFYHTDIADWGMAYCYCQKLGDRAKVLVDLGHHLPGANVEHLVSFLLDEGRMGGFHFNDRKYADDDLTTGSLNPYEVVLIYHEIVRHGAWDLAFMVDQSHTVKPKLPAMIGTVMNIQTALAKALIVDRRRLAEAQAANDVMTAERMLQQAFQTDVEPLLCHVRQQKGLHPDPLEAYAASGYQQKIESDRVGELEGASSWG